MRFLKIVVVIFILIFISGMAYYSGRRFFVDERNKELGASWKVYQYRGKVADYGFKMAYPSDWQVEKEEDSAVYFMSPALRPGVKIKAVISEVPSLKVVFYASIRYSDEEFARVMIKNFWKRYNPNIVVSEPTVTSLGGLTAVKVSFENVSVLSESIREVGEIGGMGEAGEPKENEYKQQRVEGISYWFSYGPTRYEITYGYILDTSNEYKGIFEEMVESFQVF